MKYAYKWPQTWISSKLSPSLHVCQLSVSSIGDEEAKKLKAFTDDESITHFCTTWSLAKGNLMNYFNMVSAVGHVGSVQGYGGLD